MENPKEAENSNKVGNSNKAVVQSFFNAGNLGDMDTCFSLIADDIVWTNTGSHSLSGTYRGKQQLMEALLGPLFGRLKNGIFTNVVDMVAEADQVVVRHTGKAETQDGQAYNNSYCWVIRIRDGQFVEVTEYCDTALIEQVFG